MFRIKKFSGKYLLADDSNHLYAVLRPAELISKLKVGRFAKLVSDPLEHKYDVTLTANSALAVMMQPIESASGSIGAWNVEYVPPAPGSLAIVVARFTFAEVTDCVRFALLCETD